MLGFARRADNLLKALLVIVGPTGVGKSDVALSLLKRVRGEIISADSCQIYREMDIGTDKVSREIRQKFPHHLIDIVNPDEIFNAAQFGERARIIIERLQKENKLPLLVGGSGLYVKSVVDGIFAGPGANWQLREELKAKTKIKGSHFLYKMLKEVDEVSALRIHPRDERRIIRALEVYKATGKPISYYQKQTSSTLTCTVMVGLRWERAALYRIIEQRVDKMLEKGLVKEVKSLLGKEYGENLPSMQSVGYRQIVGYLKGNYSLEEAVRLMKRNTRRFAKRQLNWFKNDRRIIWIQREKYPSCEDVSNEILKILLRKLPYVAQAFRPDGFGQISCSSGL